LAQSSRNEFFKQRQGTKKLVNIVKLFQICNNPNGQPQLFYFKI
jgi:hypothetical protein